MRKYSPSATGRARFRVALVSWVFVMGASLGVQGAERIVLCEEFTGSG